MAVMNMPRPRVGTVMIDALKLHRRQSRDDDRLPPGWVEEDGVIIPFWHSKTGIIIKWSIFLGFMVLMLTWIFVGRWHARSRIKKGLVPLGYHRWLIPRGELAKADPRYAYPEVVTYTQYNPGAPVYGMQPMPPPQYYAAGPPPPQMDAYKTDATQGVTNRPGDDYAPPPGPPPPAASRPDRNPFADPRP